MQEFKTFKSQLWLERDLEEIWSFHKDPHNLIKISPDFLRLDLVNLPEEIGIGSKFQISTKNKYLKPFVKWSVEYVDWVEEPDYKYFIDIQENGPFDHWKHKHEFKRAIDSVTVNEKQFHPKNTGTWLFDTVEFSLKGQFKKLNWVAEKMVTQLFIIRKRRLEKLFRNS